MGPPSSAGSADVDGGEAASGDQGMGKVSGMGRFLGTRLRIPPTHCDSQPPGLSKCVGRRWDNEENN